jgi:hypothetical protein
MTANDSAGQPISPSLAVALRRELGRWDLALFFVVAVLNLNTISSIAVVFVPSSQVGSVALFALKMFSGTFFFLGLGAFLFLNGRRKVARRIISE